MSGGRHGHWPPAPNSQGGIGSPVSSPSNATQAYGPYSRSTNTNIPRFGANQANFSTHVQHHNGTNLSPRTMQSTSHLTEGNYNGSVPPAQVEPSVFGDPRVANGSAPAAHSHFYGGYEQHQHQQASHQGVSVSSYGPSGSSYEYNAASDPSQNASRHASQHHQALHHHPYPASASNWMGNSPQSHYQQGHEPGHYGAAKPGIYGHTTPPSQPYKAEGYLQHNSDAMTGMGYAGQMYQQETQIPVKLEGEDDDVDGEEVAEDLDGNGFGSINKKARGQAQRSTSEFVRKLFRMLDDTSYASIVSWSPVGDSFIVKDMNDFTKHVLPRHFRHSNFASFVRQLNKYDFHKVKKPEDQTQQQHIGVDQMWEFRHPAFVRGREDKLENVKRKVPIGKKGVKKEGEDSPRDLSPTMPNVSDAADKGAEEYTKLKEQVATLTQSQDQMTSHINNLTKQYQGVIGEMLTFQKNMVQQDQLMQNLIQYLMNLEADRKIEAEPFQSSSTTIEAPSSRPQLENSDAFVSSKDAERLVTNFSQVAKESFSNMSEIAHRAARNIDTASHHETVSTYSNGSVTTNQAAPLSPKSMASHDTPQDSTLFDKGKGKTLEPDGTTPSVYFHPPHYDIEQDVEFSPGGQKELFNVAANAASNPTLAGFEGAGLRVFTVGTLQPRTSTDDNNSERDGSAPAADPLEGEFLRSSDSMDHGDTGNKSYGISVPSLESLPANMPKIDGRTSSTNVASSSTEDRLRQFSSTSSTTPSEGGQNMLRVRRSTYVPGWAVPPKILVVDDDDVCRKLGSKFLQVFGCAIDVAVDGVTAINKMNLEKYDLVLMDIVMPNLDGVSATSLIREFDPRTPIISMTSNSAPNELLSYMSSGMNDVLPKPFTKEGLLNMLEKHLIHLKTVQKMDEIPKALGLPPVSDEVMQNVLSATAASATSVGASGSKQDGIANPMAAMMGNGPEALRLSQSIDSPFSARNPNSIGSGEDVNDETVVNPLAGMGFSDDEYISMLQNLIAAGAVSDASKGENADSVAHIMGVARGEGTLNGANATSGASRTKESTPIRRTSTVATSGTKRPASGDGGPDVPEEKRSRFTELHV
ncbi:hypothetical protein CBS101457_001526 [Exobasidium rhododendri]|nr:hypothetical protein CBS101457_001526 [Exobasidium rhododendri]